MTWRTCDCSRSRYAPRRAGAFGAFAWSFTEGLGPSGFGTLGESFEVATLVQTGKIRDFPIVFMDEGYWSPLMEFLRTRALALAAITKEDLQRLDTILSGVHRQVAAAYGAAARRAESSLP